MPELFPFQKEGIDFALEREASLIADEMGLVQERTSNRSDQR